MTTDNQKTIFLEPRECFDRCILGLVQRPGDPAPVIVYSYESCISAWAEWRDLEPGMARAWFDSYLNHQQPGDPLLVHVGDAAAVETLIEAWAEPLDL